MRCGGGVNHRMALSDAALVKDNHVAAAGGVAAASRRCGRARPGSRVEVECDTLEQVEEAIDAGAELVLLGQLDAWTTLRPAVALARAAGVRPGGQRRADAATRPARSPRPGSTTSPSAR